MEIQNKKSRIEWVDTAKGICILFVIILHISPLLLSYPDNLSNMMTSIRMPFYYTISGLFISTHLTFTFIERKINRLIVPYYFFILLGNVILFIVYHIDNTEFVYTSPLFLAFTENSHKTYQFAAVWFLISLFVVYIIFLVMKKMSKGIVYKEVIYTLLICTTGYILGKNNIRIPFYIDSSMTGYFFFYLGYMLNKETKLLCRAESKSKLLGMSVFCLTLVYIFSEGEKGFYPNEYSCSWINLFCIGGIGVYGLLLLSKYIGKVPILTNIGRYSIIYLGTHQYFEFIIERITMNFIDMNTYVFQISELFVIILLCYISSIILLKYVPFLVAQKDIIHIIR